MKNFKDSNLSEEAIDTLWQEFVVKREVGIRNRLFDYYFYLVRIIAAKYYSKYHASGVEYQDYVNYASIGLLQAIESFDPSRSILFATYASHRIRGAILDEIPHLSESSEQYYFKQRYREERLQSLKSAKVDKELDQRFKSMVNLSVGLAIGFLLEDTGMYTEENLVTETSPYHIAEQRETAHWLKSYVSRLKPDQRMIVEYHYYAKMEFIDIAELMELTRSRVSQIHKTAIEVLYEFCQEKSALNVFV